MEQQPTGSFSVCSRIHLDTMWLMVLYIRQGIYMLLREKYILCDVPHLIKTVQNCWERSHFGGPRLMLVRIILMMMVHATCYLVLTHFYIHKLYRKMDSILYGSSWKTSRRGPMPPSGLYIGKKLTREHIKLTSSSRMRVDLAAEAYASLATLYYMLTCLYIVFIWTSGV